MMPGMSGYEVCQKIRSDPSTGILPVVMVTALDPAQERIKGLDAGADDFLTKPVNHAELLARVRSLVRVKHLYDTVQSQAGQLAEWNRTLEGRVDEQVSQLERLGRLKRFFSPQLAELIVTGDAADPLKSHRQEITVVFLDLRGFTAFAETAEPEEVMGVLREYHAAMGQLVMEHEGTLERFTGDGMMIFFNDPVPIPNAPERAVRMAVAMRERVAELTVKWRKRGFELDFGVGVAQGYATIGAIGFEGRYDYGAIGTVTNLAARLCGEAKPGQILIPQRLAGALEELAQVEPIGDLSLKGFHRPVPAFSVTGLKTA
jgi:class 3 adenylate cyclase